MDTGDTMSTDASKKPRLSGVFAPTVTAFHSDGSLSTQGTRAFVRFLLEEGVDGLTPLGSAGEPVAMSTTERMRGSRSHCGRGCRPHSDLRWNQRLQHRDHD